ncbi:hypothetical protein C5167_017225 [Papaver somniferum]|uniref:Uncharacterized protein n=1 Tax=Papaver somniferum TaxID=3469 RepID=A0A4Y7IIV0_PAPSO|nr:hypothetical protein C5167_017225 [Papaver somniferum]
MVDLLRTPVIHGGGVKSSVDSTQQKWELGRSIEVCGGRAVYTVTNHLMGDVKKQADQCSGGKSKRNWIFFQMMYLLRLSEEDEEGTFVDPALCGRRPNILSFLHGTEAEIFDGATPKHTTYIVTEPVMALSEKIKELGLEGTQGNCSGTVLGGYMFHEEFESELEELEGDELEEQLLQPIVQTQVQIKEMHGRHCLMQLE